MGSFQSISRKRRSLGASGTAADAELARIERGLKARDVDSQNAQAHRKRARTNEGNHYDQPCLGRLGFRFCIDEFGRERSATSTKSIDAKSSAIPVEMRRFSKKSGWILVCCSGGHRGRVHDLPRRQLYSRGCHFPGVHRAATRRALHASGPLRTTALIGHVQRRQLRRRVSSWARHRRGASAENLHVDRL